MKTQLVVRRLTLSATLASIGIFAGCSGESDNVAEQTAGQAVGVQSGSKTIKGEEVKRSVIVQEEKKVVDANTGEVISDKKTTTPVTITEEKQVKTNVKVDAGTSSTTNK